MNETEDPVARKKRKQHEAWARWYSSPKGIAYREKYRQRAKELRALKAEAK